MRFPRRSCRASDAARPRVPRAYTRAAVHRPLGILVLLLIAGALVTGCGGSTTNSSPPPQPQPTGRPSDFPVAHGKTLDDLVAMAQGKGPVLAPSVSILHKGIDRYGFGLFDTARKQITGAQVAIYTARNDGTDV